MPTPDLYAMCVSLCDRLNDPTTGVLKPDGVASFVARPTVPDVEIGPATFYLFIPEYEPAYRHGLGSSRSRIEGHLFAGLLQHGNEAATRALYGFYGNDARTIWGILHESDPTLVAGGVRAVHPRRWRGGGRLTINETVHFAGAILDIDVDTA